MLGPWNQRPIEVANLLNPALTSTALRLALTAYKDEADIGLPFELAFLILPFSLHNSTAKRLPVRPSATPLHVWIQREENQDVMIAIADRTQALVPFTREALIFGMQRGQIAYETPARLIPGTAKPKLLTSFRKTHKSVDDICKSASTVGKWLALSGSSITLFSLLGIRL